MGSPRNTPRTGFPSGAGRLLAGVAWVVLLLGLWLWGGGRTGAPSGTSGTVTGDMAAAGRPPRGELPPAHSPLPAAEPTRLHIPALGLRLPVAAGREGPDTAVWSADGVTPGEAGTALMAAPVPPSDVEALRPGLTLQVRRADAPTAEFTVEDVRVVTAERPGVQRVHERPGPAGRAELRLLARADGARTADVLVSAYLTGTRTAP
ncbi:class F sortase [Streptomyces sp. NPDC018964]|uniref:class F sortase n=1 Tax=Streptomyces sp. NPDC018964 TaxID=3365058 RepID=UPI0037B4AE0C